MTQVAEVVFELRDPLNSDNRLRVRVVAGGGMLYLSPEGYGEPGDTPSQPGSPAFLDLYDGKLSVVVTPDINSSESQKVISLEGARESLREPDTEESKMAKLEIGPGDNPLGSPPEWTTVGFEAQWGFKPLPFPDNTFDEVYASHVLEHIPWTRTVNALKEAHRVLKPGGLLEIWVPDFEYIAECYMDGICGDKWRKENPTNHYVRWANGRIFAYGPDEDNWHRAVFNCDYLMQLFQEAGFSSVSRMKKRLRGASHGAIDLGVTGRAT